MKLFRCKLSNADHEKVTDIIQGRGLKDEKDLMKHMIDYWWLELDDINTGNIQTVKSWLNKWVKNTANNMLDILYANDIADLIPKNDTPFKGNCMIIGGGPSIFDDGGEQLKYIAKHYTGTIICVDKTLKFALECGVRPDYVCNVNAYPVVATWFDCDIIREHSKNIKFILPVFTHPDTVKASIGDKYFVTPPIDNRILTNASWIINSVTRTHIMNMGKNVGCFGVIIAIHLHFKTIGLIGMEHAYRLGTRYDETQRFSEQILAFNGKINELTIGLPTDKPIKYEFPCSKCDIQGKECPKDEYKTEQNPDGLRCLHHIHSINFKHTNKFFGNECLSDPEFAASVKNLKRIIRQASAEPNSRGDGFQVVNCSPYGIMHGKPIKQMHLKDFVEEFS